MMLSKGIENIFYKDIVNEITKLDKFTIINTIKVLSEQYKKNDSKRTSLLLPVDDHYGNEANILIANLINKNVNVSE